MSLLDFVPDDLLLQITNYYRYDDILIIPNISEKYHNLHINGKLLQTIINRIHHETRFSLSFLEQRDMQQLIMIVKGQNVLSAGCDHSLILSLDGKVYSFGSNQNCQLGIGNFHNKTIP